MGIDEVTVARILKGLNQQGVMPNVLRGIVPTYTGFDTTVPTDLANATDGDPTTSTGEGKKTLGGAGEVGVFVFTLPRPMNIIVGGRVTLHSSAGTLTVYISADSDDKGGSSLACTSVAAVSAELHTKILCAVSAIKIRATISAAGDGYLGLKTITAHEISI